MDDVFIVVALDVVGSGIDCGLEELFLANRSDRDADFTLAFELIGYATLCGDTTTVFGENRADICGRAVEVVGGHFHDECDAGRAIAFIGHFLDGISAEFASAFFDGAVDVVLGHGDCFGIVDGGAETGVGGRVASAGAGG